MTRCAWVVIALAACHGVKQTPARMFPNGGGECPDPKGCAATIDSEQHYALPDDQHPAPPQGDGDGNLAPAEVREASCKDVGESLASLELGNYADEDNRAPVAKKYEKQCGKLELEKAERQCVYESTDKATVTWCAPRMMPGAPVAIVEAKACDAILDEMQAEMDSLPRGQPDEPLRLRQLAAIRDSCTSDRWTVQFGQCMRNVPVPGYASTYCGPAAPVPLRKRIEDRLAKVK